jgi:hypothetical protein
MRVGIVDGISETRRVAIFRHKVGDLRRFYPERSKKSLVKRMIRADNRKSRIACLRDKRIDRKYRLGGRQVGDVGRWVRMSPSVVVVSKSLRRVKIRSGLVDLDIGSLPSDVKNRRVALELSKIHHSAPGRIETGIKVVVVPVPR